MTDAMARVGSPSQCTPLFTAPTSISATLMSPRKRSISHFHVSAMTTVGITHGSSRMPRMNWLPRTTLCSASASASAMPITSFTTIEPTVKAALFQATMRKRPLSRSVS